MPVKLIANGFFRSGTTLLWRVLRENNPACTVFYEPCHQELAEHIAKFREKPYLDPDHKLYLWNEYLKFDGLQEKINRLHPNLDNDLIFPEDDEKLLDYVGMFDELEGETILQTNRWGFMLDKIVQRYGAMPLHMIRNPFDVFDSIRYLYVSQFKGVVGCLKNLFAPLLAKRSFHMDVMLGQTLRRFDLSYPPLTAFDSFLVVWIISNYLAVKTADQHGIAVVYEKLIDNPGGVGVEIEEKTGFRFRPRSYINEPRRRRNRFLEPNEIGELKKSSAKLGLAKELDFLIDRFCE